MRNPKKRHTIVAALALAFSAVPATAAITPAHASTYCEYFYGPTPSAEVDINNDGNPEVRVPSVSNVAVCAQADVFVHGQQVRLESCDGWFGVNCWRVYVDAQAGVTIDSGLQLCRSLDGAPVCSNVDVGPWTYWTPEVDTICIGFDLNGGYPCSSGQLLGFE